MPEMPIGQSSQRAVDKNSGMARQDPRGAGQASRDMQAVGGGIISLTDQVSRVKDTWDKARLTNQYAIAKNNRKSSINAILEAAEGETDHLNKQAYIDDLDKAFSEDSGIDEGGVRDLNASNAQLDKELTATKLREIFRHKEINSSRDALVDGGDDAQTAYNAGSATTRGDIKTSRMDDLNNARNVGLISRNEYDSEVKDIERWEYDRAMGMISQNPHAVLEMVAKGQFDIKDAKQLLDISNTAKATVKRQEYLINLNTAEQHVDNQAKMSMLIYNGLDPETGEPSSMSIADKLTLISEQDGLGMISEKFAVKARRHVTNVGRKQEALSSFEFTKILRLVSSTNARYVMGTGEDDTLTYLRNIGQLQGQVMDSKMPEAAKVSMLNTISTRTAKMQAEALIDLGDREPYTAADEIYKKEIPLFRDQALMEYFKQHEKATKDGKTLNDLETHQMQQKILFETLVKGKGNIVASIQFANKNFPKALYVEPRIDSETGEKALYVGIDENSERKIPLDEYGRVVRTKKRAAPKVVTKEPEAPEAPEPTDQSYRNRLNYRSRGNR